MSLIDEQIKQELEKFAGRYGPETIIAAKVLSYNSTDETIEVQLTSGLKIDDVRLKSMVKAGNKFIVRPADNSLVLIGRIANSDEWVVVSVDEVEYLFVKLGTVEMKVDDNGFVIKKGTDTLQKVLSDIIAEVNNIVVLMGTSPNVAALTAIDNRLKEFLK